MKSPLLDACFLGAYGENDAMLEKLVVEFLRDHVYWRRNFHPEDPPAISTQAAQRPEFQAFEARLRRELHGLSAALKRSVPFHSPRYLGHMVSDLLIPGLAAQILTLPYNPNNVSEDSAPITIDLEIKAGLQLARMLGFNADTQRADCAFGHLTSGGTLANYQALRLALALKSFPVALRAAQVTELSLSDDDWSAFNLGPRAATELYQQWVTLLATLPSAERARLRQRVEQQRIEHLGISDFFIQHPELRPPVVLAPVTAHYSWSKGLKLLGLGRAQLQLVPTHAMRMRADALEEMLEAAHRARQPVLTLVGVLGTTEFGTIDPIDALVSARDTHQQRGFGFGVHIDAAWGGYLASVFRETTGALRSLAEVQADYTQFPSAEVHAAVAALGDTDSVTVDPHKLGFLPYGAGAFIARDQRAMGLLTEEADYVFGGDASTDYFTRFRKIGRYIPEGSKSGASAAAVYVTHAVLPLDHANFGQIVSQTLRNAETFSERAQRFAKDMGEFVHVRLPYPPDSNLVCLAINPVANRDVAAMNRFVGQLHDALRCDPRAPVQSREFFGSVTTLRAEALGAEDMARMLDELGLDAGSLQPGEDGADRLLILRHTLMNPFVVDEENGISYIDLYFEYLQRRIHVLLGSQIHPAVAPVPA